ncbi:zona pellucida sperm-binding protein 3-like [Oncorhynchus kisutch]|uniref:Zona pellucida sperm-binding protein 3 n=1 Tax=Oncorhynchus kisutch TaxID=8019 RepID=A0A8C7IW13_ONCKI|nr:zona pellucida sperm-binding protein 3-like [Oncorhynchus kisutch]XP_020355860.1 zona pellucida sperm-binding protein 3-like [Oncorhynchus kisutch]XP_031644592.1 zona pellucida sperm-binding protein 3-like [Oncorhynchus kisutch]XP_031644593.1 zona pellucida sperm-binding protein 3-like [Oncorhynchus kisutch]
MGLMMANTLGLLFKQLVWFLLVENFLISPALSYTYSTDTWQQLPRRTPQFDNRPRMPPLQQTVSRPVRVETVAVTCHSDYMEIVVNADLFILGNLIDVDDLRLGVEQYQDQEPCRATASAAGDEYRIFAALSDCGTKYLLNKDSLIYANLLRYTPRTTPDGVIRMAGAVIPIECHYERKYSLDSSSLQPTWIPFTATVSAEDTLQFSLKLMTSDWLYERGSGVYFLGDPINIEASVRVAHHTRVFVSSCVATLDPDSNSVPRYVFIESDGCLTDSQLPGSRSGFMRRTQDNKLGFHIDAFRFYQEDRAELYINCHLMAVPVMDHAEPSNKACSFIDGRWRSADENDLLCGRCPSLSRQKGVDQAPAQRPLSPRLGGSQLEPRVYRNKPPASDNWSIGMKVWDQDTTLGPMIVLPSKQKSAPLSPRMSGGIDIPGFPASTGDRKPVSPGSRWRGMDFKSELEATPDPELIPTPEPIGDLEVTTEKEYLGEEEDQYEIGTY